MGSRGSLLHVLPLLTQLGSMSRFRGQQDRSGRARLPAIEQDAPALGDRLTGGDEAWIEASKSTGESKPTADAKHAF